MNARQVFVICVFPLCSLSQAGDTTKPETGLARPLIGNYQFYGGSVADMRSPTPTDKNLAFRFEGRTAKDLYDSIGPDVKKQKACTDDPDYRERRRGHLNCVYWKGSGYRCLLGLDLRTGEAANASTC